MQVTFTHQGRPQTAEINRDQVTDYLAHLGRTGRSVDAIMLDANDAAAIFSQAAGDRLTADPQDALALLQSDLSMARVVEDIYAALKTKGVLRDTDLPPEAVSKINERGTVRGTVQEAIK